MEGARLAHDQGADESRMDVFLHVEVRVVSPGLAVKLLGGRPLPPRDLPLEHTHLVGLYRLPIRRPLAFVINSVEVERIWP
uniref:Uncharacterized protein n=1 Tax=Anguilla anguilla TaxID=7936 RepID=A0A0E9TKC2_ANGAN